VQAAESITEKPVSAALLYFLSFSSGAAGMILEMTGSRILAPYLGTTLEVWTALIGVFLGCLAVGNAWGGRLADRHGARRALVRAFTVAAVWTLITAMAKDVTLGIFQNVIADRRLLAVAVTMLFLGPPAVALGIVSPCAARLSITNLDSGGRSIGRVYAISTAGGIIGTFLAGYVLFAFMGHRSVLLATAAALALCAWIAADRKRLRAWVLVLALLLGPAFAGLSRLEAFVKQPIRADIDTRYNRVWIADAFYGPKAEPAVLFMVNDAYDSGVSRASRELLFEYTRFFAKFRAIHPRARRFLVVGSGCGTLVEHLLDESPDNRIDAVELDPQLTELGRRFFKFREDPRLTVHHEDARTFLRRSDASYDVIFVDVFHSLTIPFHLATVEAFRETAARLAPGGIIMANVIAAAEGPRDGLLRAIVSTYKAVFPQVRIFAMIDPEDGDLLQNFIVVASADKEPRRIDPKHPAGFDILSSEWTRDLRAGRVMTDDFAPVEHYTAVFLRDRGGAGRDPVTQRSRFLLEEISSAVEKFFKRTGAR
jgi:spermidine synthase